MHSDMIGKIEKARRYALEPERVVITELKANFRGDNSHYTVSFQEGHWHCTSPSFHSWGISPHIMALQKLLEPMLPPEARQLEAATGVHMHSDMIGKIEKAHRYAQEPDRVEIHELKARFRGDNSDHTVTLSSGQWHCDSSFFRNWGTSAHIMALQKMLEHMLSPEARQPTLAVDIPGETVSL
jgi:hypothetical protein